MEEWLVFFTERAVLVINAFALVVVVFGAIEAFATAVKIILVRPLLEDERGLVWLRFGRWLVAGLTFQLAADIIETSISPTWEEIGRFAAIAAVRTFLNFFINRDMDELRERQKEGDEDGTVTAPK
ncbi:DUF1622 domain-containing protein [Aliirhizobium smilacinae]|uniref:DUF1622 domain-containing protein n=1 Tax=Aliirhizobium smilacinae TaxID=1395944 RepID=A0A5C4XEX2_9HYPH|nr:DUF1622 domain-containing protein [Rhizobium smilacinae]TNM60994.1 DUF1622 domain-containing protein [Rhizobium smilacinae]